MIAYFIPRLFTLIFSIWITQAVVHADDGASSHYSATKSGDVLFEMWFECPSATWESFTICCALTNQGTRPINIVTGCGDGCPFLFLGITKSDGNRIRPRGAGATNLFMFDDAIPLSSCNVRLLPNETVTSRISVTRHLGLQEPSGASVKAKWDLEFGNLTLALALPMSPSIIPQRQLRTDEWTAGELSDREERIENGQQPDEFAHHRRLKAEALLKSDTPKTGLPEIPANDFTNEHFWDHLPPPAIAKAMRKPEPNYLGWSVTAGSLFILVPLIWIAIKKTRRKWG